MAFAYSDMLETIKNKQWALADIDWDAPGAELITDEQRPKLKQFMSDVVWIEHVGARAFAAMAPKALCPGNSGIVSVSVTWPAWERTSSSRSSVR